MIGFEVFFSVYDQQARLARICVLQNVSQGISCVELYLCLIMVCVYLCSSTVVVEAVKLLNISP
jgi:hypothetical protein